MILFILSFQFFYDQKIRMWHVLKYRKRVITDIVVRKIRDRVIFLNYKIYLADRQVDRHVRQVK